MYVPSIPGFSPRNLGSLFPLPTPGLGKYHHPHWLCSHWQAGARKGGFDTWVNATWVCLGERNCAMMISNSMEGTGPAGCVPWHAGFSIGTRYDRASWGTQVETRERWREDPPSFVRSIAPFIPSLLLQFCLLNSHLSVEPCTCQVGTFC